MVKLHESQRAISVELRIETRAVDGYGVSAVMEIACVQGHYKNSF
jgi:hypothetical protein